MVLLKEIEDAGGRRGLRLLHQLYQAKAHEIESAGKAAFVLHWKSLRRQIRVRGTVTREDGSQADAYYSSRSLQSRLGAWAIAAVATAVLARASDGRGRADWV